MPGVVPGIHVFAAPQGVDGRGKPGHDEWTEQSMTSKTISRRSLVKNSAAAGATLCAGPLRARAPAATAVTPDLIAAARREGKVAFYTAMDLPVAEKLAKAFEAKYAGIAVRVERSGGERIFQRIG